MSKKLEDIPREETNWNNLDDLVYASKYSQRVWEELMRRTREKSGYWIGANDVSDIVLNAILNALDNKKMPESFENI